MKLHYCRQSAAADGEKSLFSIIDFPINLEEILESIKDDSAGAAVLFLGTVRDHNGGTKVTGLYYEAYMKMAELAIAKIEKETINRWKLKRFAAVHRVGDLKVGDVSVAIAVSSEHRNEAFEAGRYAIDRIKMEVPIWKKERSITGSDSWVEGATLLGSDNY
jgi:molybdopterin synthase catalytic subunit